MIMTEVAIYPAGLGEAEQILKLQYLSCQSEAALYDDYSMPPPTQTLWELLGEYGTCEVLVVVLAGL